MVASTSASSPLVFQPIVDASTSTSTTTGAMVLTLPKISDAYANLPQPLPSKHAVTECGHRTRFIIALQGSMFLAALLGNVICWNAALIKVAELETSPLYGDYLNGTAVDWTDPSLEIEDMRVDIQPLQTSLIFATSFAGSAAFVIPAPWVMKKIGTYYTQVFLGLITTIAAALTPWATVTDFNILYFLRFLQVSFYLKNMQINGVNSWSEKIAGERKFILASRVGFFVSRYYFTVHNYNFQGVAQCNCYPVIGSIVNNWAATREKGIFLAVLTGYTQLSAVITTPIAGYLAKECKFFATSNEAFH